MAVGKTDELAIREEYGPEVLKPVTSTANLVQVYKDYEELKRQLLVQSDWYTVQGKSRICKSGWRKLAVAFGLNDEILEQAKESFDGDGFIWRIRVRVCSRGGRSVEGLGAASTRERKFAHPDHDIYALAHTRAKSRAIADMLGAADQIAEEDTEDVDQAPPVPEPAPKKNGGRVWRAQDLLRKMYGDAFVEMVEFSEVAEGIRLFLPAQLTTKEGGRFLHSMMVLGVSVKQTNAGMEAVLKG